MTTVSARDASRGFSALLDRVEHDSEEFTVVRDGKQIARIVPVTPHTAGDFIRRRHTRPPLDDDFACDATRVGDALVEAPVDPWHD